MRFWAALPVALYNAPRLNFDTSLWNKARLKWYLRKIKVEILMVAVFNIAVSVFSDIH